MVCILINGVYIMSVYTHIVNVLMCMCLDGTHTHNRCV